MSKNFKEKVLDFAKSKSIREQRSIVVYKSNAGYINAQPLEYIDDIDSLSVIKVFNKNNLSTDELEKNIEQIEDFKSLEEGDIVLVKGTPEKVIKTTTLQFITENGSKFLRSNGKGYGKENKEVTQKIKTDNV